MRRRATTLALALLPVLLLAGWPSSSAASSLSFIPCPSQAAFQCASLPVPLDRAGGVAGIDLAGRRAQAGGRHAEPRRRRGSRRRAGPGSAAARRIHSPGNRSRARLARLDRVRPARHRLLGPLSCSAFETLSAKSATQIFGECATELGPARGGFTTQESVQDIEALRQAGGYEKVVLYGTSYGTKVAEEYAERYPQNVEAMVLDSVVPTNGPEPFAIPTFHAIAGVLEELCADGACAGITANPDANIATLAAQLRKRALSGSVYDGSGKRQSSTLTEQGLLDVVEAGDLNPALRALLPAAVQSALRHDPDPLLRLHLLSEGLIPNVPAEGTAGEPSQAIDEALFAATSCEETPFPWQRSASPAARLTEALDSLHAQPASDFYPFDAVTAYSNSLVPDCAGWPDASAPPPPRARCRTCPR